MYLTLKKKSNYILIFTLIAAAVILFGIYQLISDNTSWGIVVTVLCFAIVVILIYLILSILIKNLEKITIFRMLDKKQIALAKIKSVAYSKSDGDIFFRKHELYEFKAEIYTQHEVTKEITFYEDVKNPEFPAFPFYVYVTYTEKENKIGIIPTLYISMKPRLKDIVEKYQKQYKPHYVEAIKHNGLTLRKFKL